jgi:hypothetical protein
MPSRGHDRRVRVPGTTPALIAVLAVSVMSASCAVKARSQPVTQDTASDLAVTADQVRLRMRGLVHPFAGELERAADGIAGAATEPAVKRAAIRWKMESVPAMRAALFQPDPFTAILDTWVLTNQMADYFEAGPGRVALGSAAPVAVETSRRLEAEFAGVVSTFTRSGHVTRFREFARRWASDHPIRYAVQDRQTPLRPALEEAVSDSWSVGEALGDVTTTTDDLRRQIEVYSDHLFRQARWEIELLKMDLGTDQVMPLLGRAVSSGERAVTTLDGLAPAFTKAADAVTTSAVVIAAERQAALVGLQSIVAEMLRFAEGERRATLDQVTEERVAALEQVGDQLTEIVGEFRTIAVTERTALSREFEVASTRIVDHAAWRMAQLVMAVLAAMFVGTMLLLLVARKLFR